MVVIQCDDVLRNVVIKCHGSTLEGSLTHLSSVWKKEKN